MHRYEESVHESRPAFAAHATAGFMENISWTRPLIPTSRIPIENRHQIAGVSLGLIYLTPEIIEDLRTLPPRNGRVFGYIEPRSVYRTLRKVCEEAGLEYLATHQVGRHSFATALEEAGFSAKAVADAGGWKSVALVQKTYMHPKDAGKRAAEAMASRGAFGAKSVQAE